MRLARGAWAGGRGCAVGAGAGCLKEGEGGAVVGAIRGGQSVVRRTAREEDGGEMQLHTACLFAALIAKLDDGGGGREGAAAGGCSSGWDARDGMRAVPHKVLRDVGVGYLATCYLASTILGSGPRERKAN